MKIPADLKATDTSEALAMKLTAKKIRTRVAAKSNPGFDLEIADGLDKAANTHLILAEIPLRGVGGEFIQVREGKSDAACPARDKVDRVNTDASLDRVDLVYKNGVLNMALDTAEALCATNSAEQMLAHQLAVAHRISLDLLAQAGNTRNPVEKCRLVNTASKLMETGQKALQTIHKVRNGGQQIVTVQHVHVTEGGQAVVNGALNIPKGGDI